MRYLFIIPACLIAAYIFAIFGPPSITWTEEMVRGYSFGSLSDTGLLSIGFSSDESTATGIIGDRNEAFCGVVYEWSISNSGALILDEDGVGKTVLRLINFEEDSVKVWKEFGGIAEFSRAKNK